MINCLIDELPTEWNGYKVNTWMAIGIQIYQIYEDKELNDYERYTLIAQLLFSNEDGSMRDIPDDIEGCTTWFLNGWNHDKPSKEKSSKRVIDFDVDQWRIYADFIHNYNIDLLKVELHFWQFMGLLWNMPSSHSSFLQVVEIRNKKIEANMSKGEKSAIKKAQKVYALETIEQIDYEQAKKIDEVDALMNKIKAGKEVNSE